MPGCTETTGGSDMSERNPNPDDWNRGYTVGSGRNPVTFWLGIGFLVLLALLLLVAYLTA